ncbi:MAG: DNA polymerase III subunit alpha [Christensenellaceae bacterium]|jgi:DNA polymerase-3 subunit alpha|nr:DNA polymerase III subunit alpha [Christensenellaceae bacterium]
MQTTMPISSSADQNLFNATLQDIKDNEEQSSTSVIKSDETSKKRGFVHLHNHTEYSLLDGAAKVKDLVLRAKRDNAPAVAITDHGNVYAAIQFYDLCKANGIKPIIGCEFYVADNMHSRNEICTDDDNKSKRSHLILLAKNHEGFLNLSRLTSLSYTDGFYYKPRIDLDLLEKYSTGLICLTACIAGAVPQLLLNNNYSEAMSYAKRMKSMFSDGDFYIELQDHNMVAEKQVLPLLFRLSRDLNVKCVATNDLHYINKKDSDMHDVLLCIQTRKRFDEPDRMRFPNNEFYYKTYDEMNALFGWVNNGEALETPFEIAEKCDLKFAYNEYQIPKFNCPNDTPPDLYLRQISDIGLLSRYDKITPEIRERADNELRVIIDMGFSEYYLIVWDFISFAKSKGIPVGAGRGSGVGSIIAYAIGITNVDPLKYNLIFERFLNINRTSMPDFDIDFCYNRRNEVIQYVKNKYGADRISQIITFGKMKTRAALKDVARVFNIAYNDISTITKKLDSLKIVQDPSSPDKTLPITISAIIDSQSPYAIPDIIDKYNSDPDYKRILDIAKQIENMPRNTSIHAAGIVIYKNPAIDTIPLAKNGDEITTQFNMIEVEKLGLLKMDFLALITLTDVKLAHDYVYAGTGHDINFEELGYEDPSVYSFIGTGNTDAVFQLEGSGMKKFMSQLKPKQFEDIIAGISMYRPGPMDNISEFIKNRNNPDGIQYIHPKLKPILDVTYGIIVYQEQAMTITRVLAGYDMTRADYFRGIMSKKKKDKIPAERNVFLYGKQDKNTNIPGCIANGVSESVGRRVFADIESFASYAFNKSHAAAYAVLSYETAYYRLYYPVEFMAAVINNRIRKSDDTKKYMQVLKNLNIPLLAPNINKSEQLFAPIDKSIMYGLACIKNVGSMAMAYVVKERKDNGPFEDLYDFIKRTSSMNINKRAVESLIKGGAFDCFGETRATLLANYERIISLLEHSNRHIDTKQYSIFDMFTSTPSKYAYDRLPELPTRDKLVAEKEMLGMYITGHPLAGYEKEFEAFNFNTSLLPKRVNYDEIEEEEEIEEHLEKEQYSGPLHDGMEVFAGGLIADSNIKRLKDGKEMAVIVLEDMYDKIELLAFAKVLGTRKNYIVKDNLVKISGRLTLREDEVKIVLSDIYPWDLEFKEMATREVVDSRILYVNITSTIDAYIYTRIMNILSSHAGSSTVRFQRNGKILEPPVKIRDIDATAKELSGLIGMENIKIFKA